MRSHLLLLMLSLFARAVHAQQCQPYWSSVQGVTGYTTDLAVFDDGTGDALYIAGNLSVRGHSPASVDIARWRGGASAESLGEWFCGEGQQFFVVDRGPERGLFARVLRCDFSYSIFWHAEWTANGWRTAPYPLIDLPNSNNQVVAGAAPSITMDSGQGPRLYGFRVANASYVELVQWTGSAWNSVGAAGFTANQGPTTKPIIWRRNGQQVLVVAGDFLSVNGVVARKVAIFNGQTWEGTTNPPEIRPIDIEVYDDDGTGEKLYLCGSNASNGTSQIYRWDGVAWSNFGNPIPSAPGVISQVESMEVFDDGRGPALFVAGWFTQTGGVQVRNIARYDGHTWSALGWGVGRFSCGPIKLKAFQDSLIVGQCFEHAGAGFSPGLARWVSCRSCYADCDHNARLDASDFACFMSRFTALDPYANCTVDATIDIADFTCFLNKFAAGCGP